MRRNLIQFVEKLHEIPVQFSNYDFTQFDFTKLGANDFVYCDPPYLITNGTYNDGKRGFTGWTEAEEQKLLHILTDLDKRRVKFALSNVLYHKGKVNTILDRWVNENSYTISELRMSYSNSNYHTKDRRPTASQEILVTNYVPCPEYLNFWELPCNISCFNLVK